MVKPVYIYSDEGTSEVGVKSLQLAIPQKLGYSAHLIKAEQLIQQGLEDAAAFIIPGGADLPYCAKLNGVGNQLIRAFIEKGGLYIGICAGAYYACKQLEFIGQDYKVFGDRELSLFNGVAIGSLPDLTQQHYYDESVTSKAMVEITLANQQSKPFYYHGGATFVAPSDSTHQVLGYYSQQRPAIIYGTLGKGHYLLSGVHFELQASIYQEYVVANTKSLSEKIKEQQIMQQLTFDYGETVWEKIREILMRK
ncbi:biotin--protein ligase [Ursidibacter maritimus]|uniref:Biotin--protein ligase n=1 Tax=Ursidibacter maritimus TaxID=1331689 RepID=A0A949WGE5_9PAST|nr:BPL-N domain-containing protein [Ursidibacter maritimus]KAE9542201.1 biotin--protein ligase [Ursidibacter maritimus]MBV6524295.1 biotin--protein ligase [Ursidibacter maritimus]MBV6526199.1 biotin--protein ligase [Ursidibacter maritimus]MBV6528278.1 biotin--protein ligase [Ursidibacter maritimus]MBV6529682.1 biotin--protein ligase [Ursidibacter maritimus]